MTTTIESLEITRVINTPLANIATEYVTTSNVITEYVTTSNITTANITTANITTDNVNTFNVRTYNSNALYNINIGNNSLVLDTSGHHNTAIGTDSGVNVRGGSSNTFLGNNTGVSIVDGSNNLLLGNGADTGSDVSNIVIVGNNSIQAVNFNGIKTGNNPLIHLPGVTPPTVSAFGSATRALPISVNGVYYYLPLYDGYTP